MESILEKYLILLTLTIATAFATIIVYGVVTAIKKDLNDRKNERKGRS